MAPKRAAPATSSATAAKKKKAVAKGKQRAVTASLIDDEAEVSEGAPVSEQEIRHTENIDTIASLKKNQRNYRIRVALHHSEYKDSVPTRRGPSSVLNAVFFDSTGYLNCTAWGDRAKSMDAMLARNKLYEIFNAALKPANAYQNLGTLSATVDNGTIFKHVSGPVPEQPQRNELSIQQCYTADALKLHDLQQNIALQWTEIQAKTSRKGHPHNYDRLTSLTLPWTTE